MQFQQVLEVKALRGLEKEIAKERVKEVIKTKLTD